MHLPGDAHRCVQSPFLLSTPPSMPREAKSNAAPPGPTYDRLPVLRGLTQEDAGWAQQVVHDRAVLSQHQEWSGSSLLAARPSSLVCTTV